MRPKITVICLIFLVVVTSGCTSDGMLSLEKVNDGEIIEKTSHSGEVLEHDFVGLTNKNSVVTHERPPHAVTDDEPIKINGKFYEIKKNRTGEINVTNAVYTARATDEESNFDGRFTMNDLKIVRPGFEFTEEDESINLTFSTLYTEEERSNSALLNKTSLVAEREDINVKFTRQSLERKTAGLYNYSKKLVANSSQEYVDKIKEKYLVRPEFPESSEEILNDAMREQNYYDSSSEKIRKLSEIFDELRGLKAYSRDDTSGEWLIEYRNSTYWTEASWIGLEEYS